MSAMFLTVHCGVQKLHGLIKVLKGVTSLFVTVCSLHLLYLSDLH